MTTHADNITSKMPQLCEIDRVIQYTRQPSEWVVDYISPNLKFTQPGYRAFDILTPHVHKKILHVAIKQSINIKHEKLGEALLFPSEVAISVIVIFGCQIINWI